MQKTLFISGKIRNQVVREAQYRSTGKNNQKASLSQKPMIQKAKVQIGRQESKSKNKKQKPKP